MAKHFREVFEQLAPGSKGELVMQKRLPGQRPARDAAAEDDADEQPSGFADRYSGVGVKVWPAMHRWCVKGLGFMVQP